MSAAPLPSAFESRRPDWLGVAEAQARILDGVGAVDTERVSLTDALGRALAEDALAAATLPPWDNSAMDGYAVRAADVGSATAAAPAVLTVVGRIRAGDDPHGVALGSGEAVRIMTGAPLPRGADAVVRVEDTDAEAEAGCVHVREPAEAGRHVRPGGEDMREGDRVLSSGHAVTPGSVAVLAALGLDSVSVHRRPTVGILTTGDELRTSDRYEDVRRGEGIPESNGPMLAALTAGAGASTRLLGIGRDDPDDLSRRIEGAHGEDVLVTVGGASMGEADLVKRVLDRLGFRLAFWRVRIRPGSPCSFGWLDRDGRAQPVFGLPGNPSSAFVTFELFVRPYLLRLAGHRKCFRRTTRCVTTERIGAASRLTVFPRVTIDSSQVPATATPTGPQGSGLVRGLGLADGLAIVPEGVAEIPAGGDVDVIVLDDGPAGSERMRWPA